MRQLPIVEMPGGVGMAVVFDVLSRLESACIDVEQNRCVRVRNRNARCRRCAQACVSGCISYKDGQLIVSPERCIGCGTCASVCPTDALRPKNPSDTDLHAQCLAAAKSSEGRVVIACQDILNAADGLFNPACVAAVPCLGRVDCTLMVRLAAEGATEIILVQGRCARCDNAHGIEACLRAVQTASVLLDTWNSPVRVYVTPRLPAHTRAACDLGFDQSKRSFFFAMKDEAKDVAALVADSAMKDVLGNGKGEDPPRPVHVDEKGTLPHSVSERRRALLSSLDALEERHGSPQDIMIEVPLWSEAIIDVDSCKTCRMCATFCPTGANFKFRTKNGAVGVKHQVRKCVNCGLCLDICPTGALSFSGEVFATDVSDNTVERFLMKGTGEGRTHDTIQESLKSQMRDGGTFVVLA